MKAFPIGKHFGGIDVTEEPEEIPLFAQGSLDKIVQLIILPIYQHKKHNCMGANGSVLTLMFIKELLPELEQAYNIEVQAVASATSITSAAGTCATGEDITATISPEEGASLEKAWKTTEAELLEQFANEAYVYMHIQTITLRAFL